MSSRPPDLRPAGGTNGFALPLVLMVLTILMVAATASYLLARLDRQSGQNVLQALRASEAAEAGIAELVVGWNPGTYDTMTPGSTMALAGRALSRGSAYAARLTRLGGRLFLARSDGMDSTPNGAVGRRTLGPLLRVVVPDPAITGALVALDSVVTDSLWVAGDDTIPPAWAGRCLGGDSAIAGLRVLPATPVLVRSCPSGTCLTGNPGLARDSTIGPALLTTIGPLTFAELAAQARYTVGSSLVGLRPFVTGSPPACDGNQPLNWGEPWGGTPFQACSGYFPIVFAPGDLVVTGGRGQGLLLVAGNLTLEAGMEFYGMIIAQGQLAAGSGGAHIIGGVRVGGVKPGVGALRIQSSACVVRAALAGASLPLPLAQRSWIQVY